MFGTSHVNADLFDLEAVLQRRERSTVRGFTSTSRAARDFLTLTLTGEAECHAKGEVSAHRHTTRALRADFFVSFPTLENGSAPRPAPHARCVWRHQQQTLRRA